MTHENTAALEREAERARSQFADTAESLRDKLTPAHLVDESIDYLRHSDGALAFDNLRRQARDNPLPLALLGVSMAWFMMGGGPDSDRIRRGTQGASRRARGMFAHDHDDEHERLGASRYGADGSAYGSGDHRFSSSGQHSSWSDRAHSAGAAASGAAASVRSGAGHASHAMGHAASSAAGAVGDTASAARDRAYAARDRAYEMGHDMRYRTSRMSERLRHGFADMLEREPLVIGALGVAIGAAIGAMLPSTRTEDEYLGPYRDRAVDEAGRQLDKGIHEAEDMAAKAYESVKQEADKQGLHSSQTGETMAHRVSEAAKSVGRKVESDVRDKAKSGSDGGGQTGQTGSSSASSSTSGSSSSGSQTGTSPSTTSPTTGSPSRTSGSTTSTTSLRP